MDISMTERVTYMSKKKEEIDLNNIKPEEKLKYEIAEELGYMDKVMQTGWKSLTAKESGRIGGLITKRRNEIKNEMKNEIKNEANE
jgi:hypothetical protein